MRVLYISYSLWKSIVQARSFSAFHEVVEGLPGAPGKSILRLWAGTPEVIYAADIDNETDYDDWAASFPSSTSVANEDAALANITGLGASLQPRSGDGTPRFARQDLVLGNTSFKRVDDGTETMAVNGAPAGTVDNLWNGSGDTPADWTVGGDGSETTGAARPPSTHGWDSGARSANDDTTFDYGSLIDIAGTYSTLSFWFNPQVFPGNGQLQLQWRLASTQVIGATLDIANYVTNFDLGVWQKVTIPIADFNLTQDVQVLAIVYKRGNGQQHYFDDFELAQSGGGGGPFTFRVAAPAGELWHATMLVVLFTAPEGGWNSDAFANITGGLTNGLLLRQYRLSDSGTIWQLNSKDNTDLFGRFHPQESFVFADSNLLVGFMVKPGKDARVVVSDDEVLEFIVRDDLSAISEARAFLHYGVEVPT